MFRGNATHTFYGTGPLPDKAPEILWKHRMEDYPALYYGKPHTWAGTGWTGQAVKLGGYVFIGSQGRSLYAFEAATGKVRWRFKARSQFKATACLYDNKLYIGSVDDWLRCIDARTGDVIWKLNSGRDLDSSAVVVGGKLYIAGENGYARCLDPQTGEQIWRTFVHGLAKGKKKGSYGSETSPAVADGEYYCANYFGDFICLDAKTGEERWRNKTGDDTDASPVIYEDRVYGAAQDKNPYLHCFSRADGKLVWKARGQGGFWATPAIVDETVYVPTFGRELLALDAQTGKARWTYEIGSSSWSSACVVDDKVVFGAFDGKLRCLDKKTGAEVWTLKLGGRMHSTPCIVDGRIYIGTRSGYFYCLG